MADNETRTPMTPEEFARRMREIAADEDQESRHVNADVLMEEVLRSLGYGEGCDVYHNMPLWYA